MIISTEVTAALTNNQASGACRGFITKADNTTVDVFMYGIATEKIFMCRITNASTVSKCIIMPTRTEMDAVTGRLIPFLKLTYNSTTGRFEPPANTPKLADAQISFVVRNVQSRAVYALYYVYGDNNFNISAIISGSAPANGNNAYISGVRP